MGKIRKLFGILRQPVYLVALALKGTAAGIEHEALLRNFTFKTVVDVGANKGQFALVARRLNPLAQIISFEPLTAPAAKFCNLFRNDSKVTLHKAALGVVSGEATMHVSSRDDSSSLLPITAEQTALFPGTAEKERAVVRVGPLHEFFPANMVVAPALLKIDVQGFELEVLRGCETMLNAFDSLYVECSFRELYKGQAQASSVVEWLQARRFKLSGIYNVAFDRNGHAIQADFLFQRSQH